MTSQQRKSFGSDNHAGAHPAVLAALSAANPGDAVAYGEDRLTEQVTGRLREEFGAAAAYLMFSGTAANVFGISLMLSTYEAVICADSAHLHTDECGATERSVGCKLLTVPAPDGKLTPELIAGRLAGRGEVRHSQPRAVAITQTTELGTCYTLAELSEISAFCRESGLLLYVDGARLANAAAYLGCGLADIAAHADVLSFGGTKNGAAGAEALIVMNSALTAHAPFHRMQLMQLASKMRFLAAQFGALLDDGLWRQNAKHANAMAQRLAEAVTGAGIRLAYPVQANAVFAVIRHDAAAALQRDWFFHVWADLDGADCVVRWMTAFDTTEGDVDAFSADISSVVAAAGQPVT